MKGTETMETPDTDDAQQALIAACEQLVRAAEEREITMGDPSSLMEKRWQLAESARRARIAISNAKAALDGPRTATGA